MFVYSRKHTENGGMLVCKARHLLLIGARAGSGRGVFAMQVSLKSEELIILWLLAGDMPAMNRLSMSSPNPFQSPRHNGSATPAHSSSQSVSGYSAGGKTPNHVGMLIACFTVGVFSHIMSNQLSWIWRTWNGRWSEQGAPRQRHYRQECAHHTRAA